MFTIAAARLAALCYSCMRPIQFCICGTAAHHR